MQISFSPQRRDDALVVSKVGDVLTINGEAFDFSNVTDGSFLPSDAVDCDFVQDVRRVDGELQVTLILPVTASSPQSASFPAPLTDVADGDIALPGVVNG